MSEIDQLKTELAKRMGVSINHARIVRSPYRICPIGAHIDHQLGSVTAMTIDRAVHLAYVPTDTLDVRLKSLSFEGTVQFSFTSISGKQNGDWGNFPRGAAWALQQAGHKLIRGITGLTSGSMGEGGLSSSAAIGIAYLLALEHANDLTVSPSNNIHLDQAIENGYLGLKNGILDQAAILLSQKGYLTCINCKTATHELIPQTMPPFDILIAFSGLRKALVATGYNARVEECAAAARILLAATGQSHQIPLLGFVTHEEYEMHKHKLTGDIAKRAQHFFSESARVAKGVEAWQKGDLKTFGHLMAESGQSSIENYECGSPPLIDLYHMLIHTDGVYGARFSGAGFRGCCVAFVDPQKSESAVAHVQSTYAKKYPELSQNAPVFTCQPDDGARIL